MYYCIGYTSNNDWSTSEIPLDQYQEKLQERWDELSLLSLLSFFSFLQVTAAADLIAYNCLSFMSCNRVYLFYGIPFYF